MSVKPVVTANYKVPSNHDFSIHNLPFGIFSHKYKAKPGAGIAYGDRVLDLARWHGLGLLKEVEVPLETLNAPTLNDFIALGKPITSALRVHVQSLLKQPMVMNPLFEHISYPMSECTMHMPVEVKDYTDFYSSLEHATNVGTMFRGKENALMPNWKHLPVGYHGRASSIVISGTDIRRPKGQYMPKGAEAPVFGPTRLMDFELEVAFVVGKPNTLGTSVPVNQAEEHIFGLLLFNDWSARDIQGWEYQPLGPFLGKNFGSTASPWIVTLEALEPFRVPGPVQDVAVLPYLQTNQAASFDINLQVDILPENSVPTRIATSNYKYMYWNMAQQLAHHTVNGCNMNIGDMCASGTISGPTPDSFGSMLELTWRGANPIQLEDGTARKFLQDGDTLILSGYAEKDGIRVGFGEAIGKILPAIDNQVS